MSVRTAQIVRWLLRFLLFAATYAVGAIYVINAATGWDGLRMLGATFFFAIILAPAWWIAIAAEQFFVPSLRHRLWAHPVIVLMLLVMGTLLVNAASSGDPQESIWRDMKPFGPWILAAALADAALDIVLARKLAPATPAAS